MEMVKKLGKLKLQWKILLSALLIGFTFGGYMIFVGADTSISMSMRVEPSQILKEGVTSTVSVSISGTDDNTADQKPNPDNIKWSVKADRDKQIVGLGDDGSKFEIEGSASQKIQGKRAGKATITAEYYSKEYTPATDTTPPTLIASSLVRTATTEVTVPLQITDYKVFRKDGSGALQQISTPAIYKVGDIIEIQTNTVADNKVVVTTPNDETGNLDSSIEGVLKKKQETADWVQLEVIGGGETHLTVRTDDGLNNAELSKEYRIRAEVQFTESNDPSDPHGVHTLADGTKYIVLDKTDFKPFTNELIPSNVLNPPTSGVKYVSGDENIFTIAAGNVVGKCAGYATATAGLSDNDVDGNISWAQRDNVVVVVPFKKLGNDISIMNAPTENNTRYDTLQLMTSGNPTQIEWASSNTDILDVDSITGLVTAKKAGTAEVTATIYTDEKWVNDFKQNTKLTYTITVIDGFALNATNLSVNIGETVTLEALVTNEDTVKKEDITFVVENQPDAAGVIPTGDLISIVQSDDGTKFTIEGKQSGIAQIKVSQKVNGVIKTATCVVYVTTPVGDVKIDPDELHIDRGTTGTVRLLFEPSEPTNDRVLWSSSNTAVATVTPVDDGSRTATVHGLKGGTTTITVITEDGLKVASCDVYVREPVTGITLNASMVESTMAIGKYQLVPTILPEGDGVNRNVTWSSSNEQVCTVDENGLVHYVQPGYATIICKTEDGGYIATCNFHISVPVESITLDYTDEIMSIGDTLRITAEVLPLHATNRTVAWESSNTNVCIVDSNGLVQAVGTGNCTILCKSLDGSCTAMCNIYVKQPVTQVILNTTDITVRQGQVFWLNATCLPENADNKIVTWESRDEEVCTVDADGKVTAVGAGTTSVIATNVDTGLTAYCVVTVIQPVTGITLNSDYQLLWVGAKYAIIPNIEPIDAENKNVTYLSSDPTVASVDEYGIVTALKGGSCIIEVTTEECHLTAVCTIEVKEYVTSITLSDTDKFMNVGSAYTLVATVGTETATNKGVVWTSSDYDICSVDSEGNLTAIAEGTAIITATAADGSGVSASCIIRVVHPVTSITVEPDTVRLLVGDSAKVQAVVHPDNATIKEVTWTSSNPSIAEIDESGEIFAVGVGKCKITATSKDGNDVKGVCWVYVTPVIDISSLRINSSEIYMLTGRSRQLSVIVRPVVNTDTYQWYSTDTGIVQVNDQGVITTVGPGTAEVFIVSEHNSVTASCIVHSLAISRSNITLEQYDKYTLDIIGATDRITWRSSNPRVCTVSATGEVVARRAGTATVTAVVNDKTLSCVVRVTNMR